MGVTIDQWATLVAAVFIACVKAYERFVEQRKKSPTRTRRKRVE